MQANYLRTRPVSSSEAAPRCSSAPRRVGRGAVRSANPGTCTKAALLPTWCVGSTHHHSRQGDGHNDLSGTGIPSKAWPASSTAPLGRKRRKQGVMLSYVTSFLGVRGPGLSQPSAAGRGWGQGEAAFFPSFAAFPPDLGRPLWQALLCEHPSSKQAPPPRGWEPGRAVVV